MQKFTRPLTREIEVAGERLALTFTEAGITLRPVGSRKPPLEFGWPALLCQLTGGTLKANPTPEELTAAVQRLKKGSPAAKAEKGDQAKKTASDTAEGNPVEQSGDQEKPPATPAENRAPAEAGEAPAGGDVSKWLGRLDQWLARDRPRYHQGLRPGASAGELDSLEVRLKRPLPAELRALLGWHNGQGDDFSGSFEETWNLMSTERIAEAYEDLAGGGEKSGWQPAWVPFLDDDGGNYLCLDTSQPGNPVRRFWPGDAEHRVIAPSLAAWLEDFVVALEQGEYQEDRERGSLLRHRQ